MITKGRLGFLLEKRYLRKLIYGYSGKFKNVNIKRGYLKIKYFTRKVKETTDINIEHELSYNCQNPKICYLPFC